MINIDELQTALEKYEYVIVNFETKSGKIRRMECTRNLDFIDPEDHSGINDFRLVGPLIIAVWDWEHSAWRSFRKDSVIDFHVGDYASIERDDSGLYDEYDSPDTREEIHEEIRHINSENFTTYGPEPIQKA